MRLSALAAIACLATALPFTSTLAQSPPAAATYPLAEPALSPDGHEIAFSSGGDLWTAPTSGGEARLLVADPATDRRPIYSPDGASLVFQSARTGGGDLYVLTLATGDVRRLTWDDGPEEPTSWSPDSVWIYFHASGRDIAGMHDVFRVRAAGGTPLPIFGDRYVSEFFASAAPDGRRVAFVARGVSAVEWWRRGSSHLDQSELWIAAPDEAGAPRQLGRRDSRQVWPLWSADARSLLYVSDRGGAENIWRVRLPPPGADDTAWAETEAEPITRFRDGRLVWPSLSRDGRVLVFERAFRIWTLDVPSGRAREVAITRRGLPASPAPARLRLTDGFSSLALSPDGRKAAFVARGDVFVVDARAGGEATRITRTAAVESQCAWSPDSRRLAFATAGEGSQQIAVFDFSAATGRELTPAGAWDLSPVFSPDGRHLAFLRRHRELVVIDLATGAERRVASGTFADTVDDPVPVWSPDSRWLALLVVGTRGFTNVELVPLAGGPTRPVSVLANRMAGTIAWSPDGTFLLFDTRQRTEPGRLAKVDLVRRPPPFPDTAFQNQVLDPAAPSDRPGEPVPTGSTEPARAVVVDPDFAGIRSRLSFVPVGLDVGDVTLAPDAKTAVFLATTAGQVNLHAYAVGEPPAGSAPVARQLTTTSGVKSDLRIAPDGRDVYYLDAGRIHVVSIDRREARALPVAAELDQDFAADKYTVFAQVWTLIRDHFFDPRFNGVDWDEARHRYRPFVQGAATPDELRRVVSLMLGELNASHLGLSAPASSATSPAAGRLGLEFDRLAAETDGRFAVTSVIPLGPADLTSAIRPGDAIEAVDGAPLGRASNLDALLAHTTGKRVTLTVRSAAGPPRAVALRPVSQAAEKQLLYRAWVDRNREYVLKASGGRLGYVHMINMSAEALDQLLVDLDADNHKLDGVVVDVRNNTGGFVNGFALDVFARQSYLRMATRAVPEAPARSILGQRALELPTILVVNQHSLSDAEDFVEGYRTLKLGSIVGEPTAGWIVYTWDRRLVDGSLLRLPRMRVKGADGQDMEMRPRPVQVAVSRPLGEWQEGRDRQLDEAIRVLLKQLGRAE